MRILVTGGSGFLGRRFVRLCLEEGLDVVGLARSNTAAEKLSQLGAEVVQADLDDSESTLKGFASARADLLVNIASLGFGHAPTIVQAAEAADLEDAVFVSTTAVTTALPAPSKRVRLAAEETVRSSGLRWTIARPTMIYGLPGDRNIGRLLQFLQRSPVVPLPGGGRRLQQPVHVDDLAAGLLAMAMRRDVATGRTYDLAGPNPLPFRDLVQQAAMAIGKRPVVVPIPLRLTMAAVGLQERMLSRPLIKREQVERLAEDKAFDISPARNALGFSPRTFADGVALEASAIWT